MNTFALWKALAEIRAERERITVSDLATLRAAVNAAQPGTVVLLPVDVVAALLDGYDHPGAGWEARG